MLFPSVPLAPLPSSLIALPRLATHTAPPHSPCSSVPTPLTCPRLPFRISFPCVECGCCNSVKSPSAAPLPAATTTTNYDVLYFTSPLLFLFGSQGLRVRHVQATSSDIP
ncbi:hypothetical protein E2C01_005481 [Portunus trituberculatus]|uniref:Uncharacterized protein n=1 Tax=Portunus trituberculatus TaxID=210409 RepID=A0A5B7CZA1_PORTR|nr:hypothetical protein [Portunus trituberculatus]